MRYDHFSMLPMRAFRTLGRKLVTLEGGGKGGDAPDYSAMAAASKEAAQLGYKQGMAMQKDTRALYDTTLQALAPVMDAQIATSKMGAQAYTDYMNEQNATATPIRKGLYRELMGDDSPVAYYEAPTPTTYEYDPNEKGAASIAADKWSDYVESAGTQTVPTQAELQAKKTALTQQYNQSVQDAGGSPSTDENGNVVGGGDQALLAQLKQQYATDLTAINKEIAAVKNGTWTSSGSPSGANSSASKASTAYTKIAGSQALGEDKFFFNGKGYIVTHDEAGNTNVYNSAGKQIGTVDSSGKVQALKGVDQNVMNAYMNTQDANAKAGGALGKFTDNKYFHKGKYYYLTENEDGAISVTNSAGKEVAGYKYVQPKVNKLGVQTKAGYWAYTGDNKLMQQVLSDKAWYADKAAADAQAAEDKAAADAETAATEEEKAQYEENLLTVPENGTLKDGYEWARNTDGTVKYDADGNPVQQIAAEKSELKLYDWKGQKNKAVDLAGAQANQEVNKGLATAKSDMIRQMRGMGMNMNSGAAADALSNFGKGAGLMRASAANSAYQSAAKEDFTKRMSLAGMGGALAGYANSSVGASAGSGGTAGNMFGGMNGQYLQGMGMGNQTMMAGQQAQLQGLGSVLNAQTSAYNNNQGDGGLGALAGFAGSMAGKYLAVSSKKVKHDKEPIEGEAVLEAIDDIPVEKWTYNKGAGDEGTHVGPYAEDVNAKFGDDAAPDGKAVDLVTMNGVNLAAIKELKQKLDRIEVRLGMGRG